MAPVEQDRHDVGVEQQNAHSASGAVGLVLIAKLANHGDECVDLARIAIIDGKKSQTGGFKPGMEIPGDTKLRGSTTFAISSVYPNGAGPARFAKSLTSLPALLNYS